MTPIQDTYKSISAPSEGLFKDLGSRFIALAWPVETEEEVKAIVDSLKKKYHDARHHCYAYRLGLEGERFRANDDGEPSSSAGRPILGQIDSAGLSDVLVVVVRYFGGIKLGIPGLIRAYKTSTADALANAQVVEKVAGENWRLTFDYLSMNAVMKAVKDMDLRIVSQEWGAFRTEGHSRSFDCRSVFSARLSVVNQFIGRLETVAGTQPEPELVCLAKD